MYIVVLYFYVYLFYLQNIFYPLNITMNMMFSNPRTIKRQTNQQIQSMNFINKQTVYPRKITPQTITSEPGQVPPKKKMI